MKLERIIVYTLLSSLVLIADAEAQWVGAAGPAPEEPASFVSIAAKGDTLFAGTYAGGGVYRSTDAGASWSEILHHTNDFSISLQDSLLVVGSDRGIFLSTNYGKTWSSRISNPAGYPNDILYVLVKGPLMLAGTEAGVYRSTDGGDNWKTTWGSINAMVAKDSVVLVGTPDGIFSSTDFGLTWDGTDSGLPSRSQFYDHWPRIDAFALSGGSIFAGASYSGLYKSTDDGKTWETADLGLPAQSIFALSAVDGRLYTCPGLYGPLYMSSDEGRSWHVTNTTLANGAVFDMAGDRSRIFAATKAGIYTSSLSDSVWTPLFTEVPMPMSVRAFTAEGDTLITFGIISSSESSFTNDFFSLDTGRVWTPSDSVFPPYWFNCFVSPRKGVILGGTENPSYNPANGATLLRTTDAGKTWIPSSSGLPPYSVNGIVNLDGELFAATGDPANLGVGPDPASGEDGGLFVSTDGGYSWTPDGFKGIDVYKIQSGLSGILVCTTGGVFFSSDAGVSWNGANLGFPSPATVTSLASEGNTFYAGTSVGVFEYEPGWGMWTQLPAPVQVDSTSGFGLQLLADPPSLFAGTNTGVYMYFDSHWINVGDGLTGYGRDISSLSAGDNILYAATGDGVWIRPLQQIMMQADSAVTVPSNFILYQNYPNPFNPTTTISYRLLHAGDVTMKVYDVLGRLITTLTRGLQQAGTHTVVFNGSDFASGVYFYRLTAPGTDLTRKMMLIK